MVDHPARAPRQRAPGRAWALLLFFLAAVLTFTTAAGNAAAAAVPTVETRVGVSAPSSITAVGAAEHIRAGQHPVRAGPQQDLAQGHGVHTYYVLPSGTDGRAAGTAVLVHNDDAPKLERTPTTHPGDFEPVRGAKGKRHKITGEIWEHDQLHKNHWEVYKDKKAYENGKRSRAVWDDGRLKGCF